MHYNLYLSELLRLTTDTAVEDYHQRGMTWQFLSDHKIGILLSRVAFRIHRMPKAEERITISTWEEKPEALQLMRNYLITSESGEKLVSGYGSWLLVNLETRRIMPTKTFTLRPEITIQKGHDCMDPGKIIVADTMKPLGERVIHYSDIDANGHMNNSKYGAFVIDSLPAEYQQKTITDFRMNYSKEAMLGGTIELSGAFTEKQNKVTVIGTQQEGTCFESELYFKE